MKKLLEKWRIKSRVIEESGFARARQAMLGMVPNIMTLAFLTAENPGGKPADSTYNKTHNKSLENQLKQMNLSFRKVGGRFGSEEKSYMIMNISRDEAVQLGLMFEQEAVIWGEKQQFEGEVGFKFEYIEGNNTVQTRSVSLSGKDVQDRDDYYSELKGRKFIIPFFDDDHEGKEMRVSMDESKMNDSEKALYKTYCEKTELALQEDRSVRSKWHHRGIAKTAAKKLLG